MVDHLQDNYLLKLEFNSSKMMYLRRSPNVRRSAVRSQRDQDRGGEARVQVQDRRDGKHRAQDAEQQQSILQLWRSAGET